MKYEIIFSPEAEDDLDNLRAYDRGVPAGILIGFSNSEDWWEELLLRHPKFQARVAQARKSLREGRGRTLEQIKEKYASEAE